jgi:hypothetical protein
MVTAQWSAPKVPIMNSAFDFLSDYLVAQREIQRGQDQHFCENLKEVELLGTVQDLAISSKLFNHFQVNLESCMEVLADSRTRKRVETGVLGLSASVLSGVGAGFAAKAGYGLLAGALGITGFGAAIMTIGFLL